MNWSPREALVTGVSLLLVLTGLGIAAFMSYQIFLIQPSAGGDGFVTGAAYIFYTAIVIVALGMAGAGVALQTVFGPPGLLDFNAHQRRLVTAAGVCILGGAILAIAVAIVVGNAFTGFTVWLGAIVLGVLLLCVASGWRLVDFVRVRFI